MLRPTKIRQYVAFMEKRGFHPGSTLEGSGIDPDQLHDMSTVLDRSQCERVVSNMIRLTGDQGIGLEVGDHASIADFGIVAQTMITSRTLGDAIAVAVRFSNLYGLLIHQTLVSDGNEWTIAFSALQPLGFIFNFCVEEILTTAIRTSTDLFGRRLQLKLVTLSYPAPTHAERYRRYCECPVEFNAPICSATVSAPGFDLRLPGHDPDLNEVCLRHCHELMRLIGPHDSMAGRVRLLLLRDPASPPDLNTAAARLGVSARTLRRRLQAEGHSYQTLLARFRQDRCEEYLRSGNLSVKEIAELLGFQDTNSLRRAFRAWRGTTIGDFRRCESGRERQLHRAPGGDDTPVDPGSAAVAAARSA